MVTIKQIAEAAGVSTATVSNVLHGKIKKISPATVERIRALIDEMGYVKPMSLSVMNKGKSQLIAVVVNYHLEFSRYFLANPFYSIVLGAIEEELRKQGYYMMLCADHDVNNVFNMATTWNVDGIIVISVSDISCEKLKNMTDKPIVAIDTYTMGREFKSTVPNISLDDTAGSRYMVKHLYERGYKDIYLCQSVGYGIDLLRWQGAKSFYDVTYASTDCKLKKLVIGADEKSREQFYKQMINKIPFKRKTAFYFIADFMAVEAMRYLQKHGVCIPDDVGICGFDDDTVINKYCVPGLTTIHQDFEQKGILAARQLIKKLEDPDYELRDILLGVHLVSRESV